MAKARWERYKEYSGCSITGVTPVSKPLSTLHMDRAYYLTALIEAPLYGTVQSYDGAAMSGGPLHNIAVTPRGLEQSSLFSLLQYIHVMAPHTPELQELWLAFKEKNWIVEADGKLHDIKTGLLVSGQDIRNEFTPVEGKVPKSGPAWIQASQWAWLHHRVFAASSTFDAQKQFAINWLIASQKDTEALFYRGRNPKTIDTQGVNRLSPEEDLAMCVYHCYSVNAPAPAKTELVNALRTSGGSAGFARTLLQYLRDNTYGNWDVRYKRTRDAAMRTGFWPTALFEGTTAIFKPRA